MGMRLRSVLCDVVRREEEKSQPDDGGEVPFHAQALALTKRERATLQVAA